MTDGRCEDFKILVREAIRIIFFLLLKIQKKIQIRSMVEMAQGMGDLIEMQQD
jgi:hypothetical protein